MKPLADLGRNAFAALLCLALVLWSVLPAATHQPTVFETIQDHLETIADHGHSHGFEEDLYWAMHGHPHDMADHDHTQAFLIFGAPTEATTSYRDVYRPGSGPGGHHPTFRIERPPRA